MHETDVIVTCHRCDRDWVASREHPADGECPMCGAPGDVEEHAVREADHEHDDALETCPPQCSKCRAFILRGGPK